ncbi:hypothetical protein CDL15_Pgr023930 [Punica granatum]|uniref:Protein OS9-like domain-containing protein n=1 Tax=Punica granatum TaxID=22663 RepID=A0A218XVV5_PUNGR|nr:hypothetical protein CDL15_Pgr023930 [Punica granatum]
MRLTCWILLSLTAVLGHVLADQIFTAHVGGTFGRSAREPKYDIQFHSEDSPFHPQEGWWSYEFCYQKQLRQFHLEDEKVVQEFVLGVYDEEATVAFNQNLSDVSTLKDPRSKDAAQRLFQEEKPVKHTINCNVLPRDYKENKAEVDEKLEDSQIVMVTDMEDSSNDGTRE